MRMNCEEALALISSHIDGEATQEEETLLQAHLETCASCREILRAYEEINREMADLTSEPPGELISGVMERITEQPAEKKRSRRFMFGSGTAIAAAAAVLVLLIGTGKIPDFRQGRATTARSAYHQEESEKQADELSKQSDQADQASISAPLDASENTAAQLIAEPSESMFMVDPASQQPEAGPVAGEEAMSVEILDDPQRPAEESIPELALLQAEESVEDGSLWYYTKASSAREIVKTYSELYVITAPETLDQAEDDAPCQIHIVEP